MGDPLDIKALARRSHLLRVGGNGKKSAQCIARAAVGSNWSVCFAGSTLRWDDCRNTFELGWLGTYSILQRVPDR